MITALTWQDITHPGLLTSSTYILLSHTSILIHSHRHISPSCSATVSPPISVLGQLTYLKAFSGILSDTWTLSWIGSYESVANFYVVCRPSCIARSSHLQVAFSAEKLSRFTFNIAVGRRAHAFLITGSGQRCSLFNESENVSQNLRGLQQGLPLIASYTNPQPQF